MAKEAPTRRKIFDVVGECSPSLCGEDRQKVLHDTVPGAPVELQRQPDNPHDRNAILVTVDGYDIGYIPAVDAIELAPAIDAGLSYQAIIHEIRGGIKYAPNYGAKIAIAWLGQKLPNPRPLNSEQEDYRMTREKQLYGEPSGCLGLLAALCIVPGIYWFI